LGVPPKAKRAKDYLPEENKEPVFPYHAGSLCVTALMGLDDALS
jgi:hypothetical protein